ncbi:MAG: hypothetical protein IJU70_08875 [Lentisphaeria bacterium]|nr:hypothetical protein [Lentisphaeria bacterium]
MRKNTGNALPSPAFFWLLNCPMTAARVRRDLRRMAEAGARAVCPHPWPRCFRTKTMPSAMSPEYLSEAYFRLFRVIVQECRRLGLACYLYDEGGWPSGNAAGKVRLSSPEEFAPFFLGPDLKEGRVPLPPPGEIPAADLLNRDATAKFIELTHAPCVRAAGEEAGRTLFASFTDEPHFTRTDCGRSLPWARNFDRIFLRRKKYGITPFLGDLFRPPQDDDPPEVVRARIDFHDVLSQLFVENYFLPIRRFCRGHGLLSGGHINADDDPRNLAPSGSGHVMRSLRALDLPGVDVIARQIMPGKETLPFAKFASSVARQAGRKQVLAEIFAVYGSGITPDQQKFIVDTLAADGVNVFVLSGYPSSHKNMVSHLRPHLDPADPLWEYAALRSDYIARLGRRLTEGSPCVPAAVYFDQRAVWAGAGAAENALSEMRRLAREVFDRGSDFDFVDDDALCRARRTEEGFRIGAMRYRHLLLPERNFLSPEAAAHLKKEGIVPARPGALRPLLPGVAVPGLRVVKRRRRNGETYFLLNTKNEELFLELPLPGGRTLLLSEIGQNSRPKPLPAENGLRLAPFGSVLLVTGKAARSAPLPQTGRTVPLHLDGMTVLRRMFCGAEDFRASARKRALKEYGRGDWRKYAGEGFSGTIRYRWRFDLEDARRHLLLSLGEVRYAATVRLNGKRVGGKLFSPFDFILSSGLKKGRNRLEIDVTNTPANALLCSETRENWRKAGVRISPYEERQRAFESESLPSGLFGPVTLKELLLRPAPAPDRV